jgi:hypothetical protein
MPVSKKPFGGDGPKWIQSQDLSRNEPERAELRAVCGMKIWAVFEGDAPCVRN